MKKSELKQIIKEELILAENNRDISNKMAELLYRLLYKYKPLIAIVKWEESLEKNKAIPQGISELARRAVYGKIGQMNKIELKQFAATYIFNALNR